MAVSTLSRLFPTGAAFCVVLTSSIAMSAAKNGKPAASSAPCTTVKTRPAAAPNAIVTRLQLAYDLCYLAGQFPTAYPIPPAQPFPLEFRVQLEDMMRQIALEGSLIAECPRGYTIAAGPAATVDHFAELHQFGCGPTPAPDANGVAYGSQKPMPTAAYTAPNCPTSRPAPVGHPVSAHQISLFYSQHPPTGPKAAVFDLCEASSRVMLEQPQSSGEPAPLSAAEIERYMFRLMIDVDLALTCGNGRSDDNRTSIDKAPNETNPDYIKTRHIGCEPIIP